MADLNRDDNQMHALLTNARTIAVVGHSDKPHRTSYQIAAFLRDVGYTVYPVNPTLSTIDGEVCYPSVRDIPDSIDIVNVFRRSEHLDDVVDDALSANAKAIWTQLGVVYLPATNRALEAGLDVAVNRCIKVEYMRLDVDRV